MLADGAGCPLQYRPLPPVHRSSRSRRADCQRIRIEIDLRSQCDLEENRIVVGDRVSQRRAVAGEDAIEVRACAGRRWVVDDLQLLVVAKHALFVVRNAGSFRRRQEGQERLVGETRTRVSAGREMARKNREAVHRKAIERSVENADGAIGRDRYRRHRRLAPGIEPGAEPRRSPWWVRSYRT